MTAKKHGVSEKYGSRSCMDPSQLKQAFWFSDPVPILFLVYTAFYFSDPVPLFLDLVQDHFSYK